MLARKLLLPPILVAAARGSSTQGLCQPSSVQRRMVALDLDGTLLNRDHTISDVNREAIRSIAERGVTVALCSGRSTVAMQAHAVHLDLGFNLPVVSFNGAAGMLARSPGWATSAEELFTTPVTREAVEALLEVCASRGLLVQYYVGNDIYVVCKTPEHFDLCARYAELTGVAAHKYVDSYEEGLARSLPYKMLVMTDDVDGTLDTLRASLPAGIASLVRGTPPFFVEVLHPSVSKGDGLQRLCAALDVPTEVVVAFGDGDNDIEFLQTAGLGVAMANARPTLKAVADRVTDFGHDDDGVARALAAMEERGELMLSAPRAVALACPEAEDGSRRVATVQRISAASTRPLRERVLWPGQPEMCALPEDEAPGAVHLGAALEGDEGPLLGTLSLFMPDEGGDATARFRKLAVDPDWRGAGIGSALVQVAAAEARRAGMHKLACDAREPQSGFYTRLGFVTRGEPFVKYEGGGAYVRMELAL